MAKTDLNELLNAVENKNNTAGLEILQNYLGEYLKAYFLVGYDHDGNSVLMVNGKSEQDFDSIECLVNRCSNVRIAPPGETNSKDNEQ
jgi:hypothetical protein